MLMKHTLRLWATTLLATVTLGAQAGLLATVTLTPDSGSPGDTIQVDGPGWLTDDSKTVALVETESTLATALPVGGVFSTTFVVPELTAGVYTVRVLDGTEDISVDFTVVDATAVTEIDIAVESDLDGDGTTDSTVAPFSVLEYGSPTSSVTFTVSGGSGGEYTLTFSNLPGLGYLVDPTTTLELVEGSVLATTGGSVTLEFHGVPQATASFSEADSFIVRASDDSGNSAPVIVDLSIVDVNQPIVVSREPAAVVAANTTATIALVDFSDIDSDGVIDPSVYDTDGDAMWFDAPLGVSDLGASVSVAGGLLTYYGLDHSAISLGDPLTDTIAVDVWDGDAAAAATMIVSVEVHPTAEFWVAMEGGDAFIQEARVGYGPTSDVYVNDAPASISDLTRELAPPEVPSAGFAFSITNSPNHPDAALRDVRTPSVPASGDVWELSVRTSATDGLGSYLLWDVTEAALVVEELVALTGEEHSAVITNTSTGEAWDIASANNGSIFLDDSQAYTFELSIIPSAAAYAFDVYLEDGWNLVSVPGEGDLTDLDALSNSAFVYDSGYVGLADIDSTTLPTVAYGAFVNSFGGTASLALDLDSSHVRSVTVDLVEGWNLIGAPSDVEVGGSFPTSVITAGFTNESAVYGYSPASGYFSATELYPGNGYWVYNDSGASVAVDLTQVRHLDVDGTSLFHPAPPTSALGWTAPLTMELGDGTTRSVEIATGVDAKPGYDHLDLLMPPTPPIANYSELYIAVEDTVGRLMRSAQTAQQSGTEWVLSARVQDDDTVLRWQRPDLPAHWRLTIQGDAPKDGRVVDMREEQSMRLGRGVHEYRVALSWVAPTRTRLLANYPNPFNPETWIPFELTQASDVAVRIYDSAGSLVRSFDLGHRAAGYYSSRADAAYWDGRNASGEAVASGVYVYELRAGDYHAIRRMLVLK